MIQDDSDFKKKQKEQEKALKEAREKAAKGPLGLLFMNDSIFIEINNSKIIYSS